jgi:histidine ammonia-lyase
MRIVHHRFPALGVLVAVLLHALPATAKDNVVLLDGHNLLFDDVVHVAAADYQVTIAPSALELMQKSYELLLAAEKQKIPIYGLNRGVGLNKDKPVGDGEASRQFNLNNLRSASAGVGPEAPEMLVRAAMVIRLNTMLLGRTGARPRVAELYRDFLNKKIHPVLPSRASLGEADILILAHVGLAMTGEGDVIYAKTGSSVRTRMPAQEALADAKIEPLVPFAKDSLAIMSSNAYSAAVAMLAALDVQRLLATAPGVLALSLEGLKGNIAPFLKPVQEVRDYASTQKWAARVLDQLKGSFLWECTSNTGTAVACDDDERPLQDPLSYRTASHVLAAADDALAALFENLMTQINSSDDNPVVIFGIRPDADAHAKVRAYYVECDPEDDPKHDPKYCDDKPYGAVIPTANFEPLPWVMPLQTTSIALGHVSRAAVARITRLSTPEFTWLTRFLTDPKRPEMLGFSAIHQTFAALDAEIQGLIPPVSTQTLWTVGDIDDTATSSLDAANRLQRIVDNLFWIEGIELLHAAQAIDLRRQKNPSLNIGAGSGFYYHGLRSRVPFLDKDRPLTPDIAAATNWLRSSAGP